MLFYIIVVYLNLLMKGYRLDLACSGTLAKFPKGFSLSCKLSPVAWHLDAIRASVATLSNSVSILNLE